MHCPYCSHADTKVLESRLVQESLRRRRECENCSNRFTTYERAVFRVSVLKKDGREEPFQFEKIKISMLKACSKADEADIEGLAKRVEQKILLRHHNPVKTTEIGKLVLRELRKFDKMAYLRFASIHKAIEDPKMLEKELLVVA